MKNTPEKIHIGIMTRLIKPLTLSIFCARLAVSNPIPPKEIAPNAPRNKIDNNAPCTLM